MFKMFKEKDMKLNESKIYGNDTLTFRNIDFEEGSVLNAPNCKKLKFVNCYMRGMRIIGDFDKITFKHSRGNIVGSTFNCKEILHINVRRGIMHFKQSCITGLELIKVEGEGFFEYENPTIPLKVVKIIVNKESEFCISCSICICDKLEISNKSTLKFDAFAMNTKYFNLALKTVEIKCEDYNIQKGCKIESWGGGDVFSVNGEITDAKSLMSKLGI